MAFSGDVEVSFESSIVYKISRERDDRKKKTIMNYSNLLRGRNSFSTFVMYRIAVHVDPLEI